MDPSQAARVFPIFVATWVVLGVGSFAFFHYSKNVELKRKVWPIMTIGVGALFIAFVWLMGIKKEGLYFMVPAVVLITALNLKGTKFCSGCGKTLYAQPFSSMEFCPKCGNKLTQ